jgi:Ca2+-binding EF-hand superfamily protein
LTKFIGLITNEQFKAYYRVLLPKDLNEKSKEEIIEKLFCLFDIDGDGCLSFTEFLISFWLRCKAPIKEKYTWIFNMLDEDRNGYLNYSELRNALTLCLNLNDLDELLEVLNKERNNLMKSQSFEKKFQQQQQYAHKSSESSESSTDDFTDYNSDDFDSESSDSFLYIGSMATKAPQNSKRKYDLYSRTAQLVDDKLNETVHLLHAISCSFDHKLLSNNSYSSNTSSSFSFFRKSHSTDSLDSLENQSTATNSCANENSGVQIKRENFLKLCEKYKLFRKLLLPIKYFYEENLFMD